MYSGTGRRRGRYSNRAHTEKSLGSAQWYWLHTLEAVSDSETFRVLKMCWDMHKQKQQPMTGWLDYKTQLLPYDHRTIGTKELVIDIDWDRFNRHWGKVYETNKSIVHMLQHYDIPYVLCQSGNRGYHIHIFFDSPEPKLTLLKRTCEESKVDVRRCDFQLLGNHMVRLIGGRSWVNGRVYGYKSWIPKLTWNMEVVKKKEDVLFPPEVDVWMNNSIAE